MKNTVVYKAKIPKPKQKAATAIIEWVETLIQIAEPEDLIRLQKSLSGKIADDNCAELDLSQLLESELNSLQRHYDLRRELLANSITSPKVAELLGYENRSTVRDRRIAKKILGVKEKGVYRYPLWQFDPQGDDGIIDGFPEVLAALNISDFAKLNWLCKPSSAFEEKTPVEMLKQGKFEAVIIEARVVRSESS